MGALRQHTRLTKTLGLVLLALWVVLAIRPLNRQDWLLENVLVVVVVPLLAWYGPGLKLSNASYTLMAVFFALHLVGAHYTYADVPWFERPDGRNHFDRIVHFLYGLLFALPTLELFAARVRAQGFWAWLVPLFFLGAHGGLYEAVEWGAATWFGGDLGVAYLGTQGDEWDAQKDMTLAFVGAAIGILGWHVWRSRDRAAR